jgi:hypothetical protein
MRNARRTTLLLTTLFAAACGVFPVHAQDPQLAQLTSGSGRTGTPAPLVPISDDGDDLTELLPATQLLITFSASSEGPASVHVLDEAGRIVLDHTIVGRPGRLFLALDVADLASGRYLVRVQEGAAVSASRFLRP